MRTAGVLAALVPTLSILPFALLSSMPWHAPYWAAFALPVVALTAIYLWAEQCRHLLPAPVVLLIGLFVDFVTDGPLGYWAALYLLAYAIAAEYAMPARSTRWAAFKRFMFVLAGLAFVGWLIASIYFWQAFDTVPFLTGAVLGCVIWPIVSYLLDPLIRWLTENDSPATFAREASPDV